MKYALNLAYNRALESMGIKPGKLLIDGRDRLNLPFPYQSVIRGDQKERPIMAASILAKVTRDKLMQRYAKIYPEYDFQTHKGYGTRKHRAKLLKHGISPIHRKNFYIISFGKTLAEMAKSRF
ncbi:MAG: Ribonuclease HII [uncultured bacterium]|nr:MAG: Ribonuclease HII [uncultured bacterium]